MAVLYQQVIYPFPVWNEKLLLEISLSRIDWVCEELIWVLSQAEFSRGSPTFAERDSSKQVAVEDT